MALNRFCKQCKKLLDLSTHKNRKFCNKKCHDKYQRRNRLNLKCKQCGKQYTSAPSNRACKNNFCCFNCAKIWLKKTHGTHHKVKCPYCEKINVKTNQEERESKYCNTKCSKKHRIERNTFYCTTCKKKMYRMPYRQGEGKYYCCKACYFKGGQPKLNGVLSLKSQHRNRSGLELKGRELLESLGVKYEKSFIEQVPLLDQYCVDVYFPRRKLVIQWDGDYWHRNSKQRDSLQKRRLRASGYKVLRVKESEFKNYEKVKLRVEKFIKRWRD
jgi:very-short-patch-repair endonuclease